MLWIVAIGIETEAAAEPCFRDQRAIWRALNDFDYALMHVFLLLDDLGQGQVALPCRHQSIEGVDAPIQH